MGSLHHALLLSLVVTACAAPTIDGPSSSKPGSGSNEVANLAGDGTAPRPTANSPLVAFKGGASIALRWSGGDENKKAARHFVLRDGMKVATVEPGFHADFPEKDGKGWVDTNIAAGAKYTYSVQAVDGNGGTSELGAPLEVTAPAVLAPPPNIRIDTGGDPSTQSYLEGCKAFLEIWYPKLAFALAQPDYEPSSAFTLLYDPNGPGFASAEHRPDILRFGKAASQSKQDLGAVLHEATHMVHDAKPTPGWIVEGVADWSREYMLHDRDPRPTGPTDDYKHGYSEASYFLNWIEETYKKPIIRDVIVATHKDAYVADFFFKQTGKRADALWEELSHRHVPLGPLKFTDMNDKCVDGGGPVAETGHAEVATCSDAQSQVWTWGAHNPDANDGLIWLESDGGCLDVKDKSKDMGALVRTWPCGKHEGQMWKRQSDGTLLNPNSGFCLDNPDGSTLDGTQLRTWDCNGSAAQRFALPQ